MSINTNKTHRHYIRYAIELEATLILEESMPVQCVIQDFCSGGLFLGFKQSIAGLSFPDHKNIKIHFSISPEYGWEDFQLDAKIMHVSSKGIGVAVENMPVSAFNALKKESSTGAKTVSSDRRSSSSDKSIQDNFKKEIKTMLEERFPQLLARFFEYFDEDSKKTKERSADFMGRSPLDDLITTLKFSRESIVCEFCSSILFEVDYIFDSSHKKDAETATDGRALALIEKEDFQDWLNLSSIIRKLKNHYENPINQLEGKLSRVFGIPANAINNPLSPAILCDIFRGIILQFNLDNDTKQTLYSIFQKTLINSLCDLFEQLDKVLVSYGAPDQLDPHVIQRSYKNPIETRHSEHCEPENKQYAQNGQLPSFVSSDNLLNLLQIAEQKHRQPVAQIARKLLDIFKETDTAAATQVDGGLSEKTRELITQTQSVFTAEELVAAISKIQKNVSDHSSFYQNPIALQKYLQDTLENSGNSQKILSTSDINHLEVYSKLFETLFNDLLVSPGIKSYIESIHLPLLSLPLQGNDFLDPDSHPVRNILNQLAVLESAVKGNKVIKKTNIKKILDKHVTRIAQEAITNPNVFAEVEQELNKITVQVNKSVDLNIRRLVEAYEGKQKLEIKRRFVQQEIDKRCAGKSIPKIIPMLLTSGWQHLLVITELNQENGKDEKSKYFKVIDDLILWLSDQDLILEEQTGRIITTLEFIEDELGSVCTNTFTCDSIIEVLTALLLGEGKHRVRKAVEMITIEPLSTKKETSFQMSGDKWTLQVEQLRVGEWLTILRNSEGFEPMKLVWIGDSPQIFVFVNRDGFNKLEFTKAELAELMQTGAAIRIESLDVPLMDRATNMMLQKMHEKLIYNATHDQLTGLFTRDEFIKQLKHEMTILGNSGHMLCQIEIHDYRMICNICGAAGGDELLKKQTHLLISQLRKDEIFARLGDNTFGVLFKHCSPDEGYEIAKKLVNLINDSHFEWEDKSFSIGINIGLAPFIEDGYDVHQLLQLADSATISAERFGYNSIQIFKEDDEVLSRQNKVHEWAGQIDKILSENKIFLRCQKIAPVEWERNDHTHYEILLGVRDNDGNTVQPDNFIPAVERCKRMPEIDKWIIRHVFDWIEHNRNYFDQMDGFSINLSGQSVNTEGFLEFLKELLASSSIPLQKLTFEITETVAVVSLVYVKRFIKQIKQFGCKFSLDDFGSGYSSYAYLKSLNVDYLKIDGAFVKDIANNKADVAIVKSMNEIAHSLGIKTIAEYVENNEIRDILREIGVDYVQGYGIQKPILLTELVDEFSFSEDNSFAEDIGFAEDKGIAEDHSSAEGNGFSEDNGLADDNKFWGF